MAGNGLFISYGHDDMQSTNWLERLKLYLAPLKRQETVDIWDDTRIAPGSQWRLEIQQALDNAAASILLVGPAFLASEFIAQEELPVLLQAARERGAKVYPLIVGYCAYKTSVLSVYQAFNDPDEPLEALPEPEQNRILNEISMVVDHDLREMHAVVSDSTVLEADTLQVMQKVDQLLDTTWTAFQAQARRRNQLVTAIRNRLGITEMMQYENFFFRYFDQLNREEKFQFDQIRAITEGPMYSGNQEIIMIMESHPEVFDEIPELAHLQQHLVFWLNKYEKVFVNRPEMCLLYTGVEDGVPFPSNIGGQVKQWIEAHR